MRLQRKDLVNQFEEIVKQEIVNHNKQILASNLAFNELSKKVDFISHKSAESIARLEGFLDKLNTRLSDLEKDFDKLEFALNNKIAFLAEKNEALNFDLERSIDYVEENYTDEDTFLSSVEALQETINVLEKCIDKQKFFIHSEFNQIKKDLERGYQEFQKQILEKPSEIPALQSELEKKIACASTDTQGVLKELNVVKKEVFIAVKKIEDIYKILGRSAQGGKL